MPYAPSIGAGAVTGGLLDLVVLCVDEDDLVRRGVRGLGSSLKRISALADQPVPRIHPGGDDPDSDLTAPGIRQWDVPKLDGLDTVPPSYDDTAHRSDSGG